MSLWTSCKDKLYGGFRSNFRDLRASDSFKRRQHDGFTLIEVAMSLAVVGLVFGALLAPMAAQIERRQYRATEAGMEAIARALIGFAQSRGRLPCPDHDFDGLEEVDCSATGADGRPRTHGLLPFADLGVPPEDYWGRRYRYAVSESFTRVTNPGAGCSADALDLCDDGSLSVRSRGDDPSTPDLAETKVLTNFATRVPAVVVSHGRNGAGAPRPGVAVPGPIGRADELENVDGDGVFVLRDRSGALTGACSDDDEAALFCEYDDVVIWLSARIVLHELVNAGRLP